MTDLERARAWLMKLDWNRVQLDDADSLAAEFAAVRDEALEEAAALLEARHEEEFANPHAVDWSLAKTAVRIRNMMSPIRALKDPQSSGGGGEGK